MWNSCCSRPAWPLLLLGALAGCGAGPEPEAVVARVGESSLTLFELDGRLPDEGPVEEQRRRFVEEWVRQQLLFHEALERGIHERPRIGRLVEQARRDVIVAAFLDGEFENRPIEISRGDVESYYQQHPGEFRRLEDEIRAQHILVASRREAESLRQELLHGGGFDDRAVELSLDRATAASAGDLGHFTAGDRPELWEACADLQPGEISSPVATDGGYHIVLLRDRKKAGSLRSLDEAGVREGIEEALVWKRHRGRVDSLVSRLRREYDWHVDEALLRAP